MTAIQNNFIPPAEMARQLRQIVRDNVAKSRAEAAAEGKPMSDAEADEMERLLSRGVGGLMGVTPSSR